MAPEQEQTEWFRSWFDSEYYPMLYNNRDEQEARAFLRLLVNKLELAPMSSILDLACGKGRHSLALSELGFLVHGIDLSPNSIKAAQDDATDTTVFQVADMRTFQLNRQFDAVFNLFTSFGYFDNVAENLRVLQQVKQHLHRGSWFVIDYFNATKVVNDLVPSGEKLVDDVKFSWKKFVSDGFVHKHITVSHGGKEETFAEKVQLFHKEDFVRMLTEQGFEVKMIFGNYSLEPFSESASDRVILACKF
jgi:SAM-dependent methyltransferase